MNRNKANPLSVGIGLGTGAVQGAGTGKAAGAAIGSLFGPLGTAIGASIGAAVGGFAGGAVGSAAASGSQGAAQLGTITSVAGSGFNALGGDFAGSLNKIARPSGIKPGENNLSNLIEMSGGFR